MSRNDPIRVGIAGALGRMGGEVIKQAAQRSEFRLAALFEPNLESTLSPTPNTPSPYAMSSSTSLPAALRRSWRI